MALPLFIIGLARSGTNLVARMLDRHSQVGVALDPYMPVFRSLRDSIVRERGDEALRRRYHPGLPFQDYYFDAQAPDLMDLMAGADLAMALPEGEIGRLRQSCADRAALESPELGARMGALSGETYDQLLRSMFAVLGTQSPQAQWIGCKEVWVEDFVPLLARALPESRFVTIERDPRAVVASLLAVAAQDATQAAHTPSYMRHWRKGIALNRRFQAQPHLASRLLVVGYEEVVNAPEAAARALCAHLGLDYEGDMIALSEQGWTGNSGYQHDGRDVYSGSRERWRRTLAPEVIATVDYLCGPEMRLTAYEPASGGGLTPDVVAYLRRAGLEAGSWRSDSGDDIADLAGEALRHATLTGPEMADAALLRRCFLFPEIYHAIRRARGEGEPV